MNDIALSTHHQGNCIPTLAPSRVYEFVPVKEPVSSKTLTWSPARCRINVIQYESLKPPAEVGSLGWQKDVKDVDQTIILENNSNQIPPPDVPVQWRSLSSSEKLKNSDSIKPLVVSKWYWSSKSNSKRLKVSSNYQQKSLSLRATRPKVG